MKGLDHFAFHQQWMKDAVAPHPHQCSVLSVFWITDILTGEYLHLIGVLTCIFDDIWCGTSFNKLICQLYIFFSKVSDKAFGLFLNWAFLFSCWWVLRVLCIFWITVLYQLCFLQYFSQSVACLLILLILSFLEKLLILMTPSLPSISFTDWDFGVVSKRVSPYPS